MNQPRIHRTDPAAEYFFAEGCHILELWNDAADPQLSIARARLPPATRTRWHRLQGIAERYLLLEGQGLVEVEGLPAQTVGPGSVVVIPPGAAQRIANTGAGDLVFLALCTPRFELAAYRDAGEGEVPL